MEELTRGCERGVNAGPQEDEKTADGIDQRSEPIPPVSIHHNVEIASKHGTGCDKNSDTSSVVDIPSRFVDEVCRRE